MLSSASVSYLLVHDVVLFGLVQAVFPFGWRPRPITIHQLLCGSYCNSFRYCFLVQLSHIRISLAVHLIYLLFHELLELIRDPAILLHPSLLVDVVDHVRTDLFCALFHLFEYMF